MKLLRILTGHHAGAQVLLEPGTYRIGTDDDADIQITDWRGVDVLLSVEADGVVSSQRLETATMAAAEADMAEPALAEAAAANADANTAAKTAAGKRAAGARPAGHGIDKADKADEADADPAATLDPGRVLMVDFVPMQFGDTALCIGWADAEWPSDLALLATLLSAPGEAQREADNAVHAAARVKRRRYTGIAALCVVLSAGAVGISFALTTNVSRAALTPPDVQLEQSLNRALFDAHLDELHATRELDDGAGDGGPAGGKSGDATAHAVVGGMVRSSGEDALARQIFERMRPGVIVRRYGIADDTARGIRDAIGVDGVQVKYDGHGVFTVSGTVANRQRVESALTRIRGDLDHSVTQIRVALTDVAQPASAPALPQGTFTALVSSGDVQYAETPDGVKHIYAVPDSAAASEATTDAAASAAPGATTNAMNATSGSPTTTASVPVTTASAALTDATPASREPRSTENMNRNTNTIGMAGQVPLPSD